MFKEPEELVFLLILPLTTKLNTYIGGDFDVIHLNLLVYLYIVYVNN